ncbi:MAG: carbon-nitrogen hydrolase family protein [Pseudomonadota bacterium]
MRVALLQMTSSDDPSENLETVLSAMQRAKGADLLATPEVTNCVSLSRHRQVEVLHRQADDPFVAAVAASAAELNLPVLLGSIALKTGDADGRFANRSVLINGTGIIQAHYDKAHMFDVVVSEAERYRESEGYRPGERLVTARLGEITLGLSVCYDLRFPTIYRRMAQAGAQVLTVPSAFSPTTGSAHWHVLLRARAIETGCFVLAPAQTGTHRTARSRSRETYGHSLVVSPWGEVLGDMGTEPGLCLYELDITEVERARRRIPSLTLDRELTGPR